MLTLILLLTGTGCFWLFYKSINFFETQFVPPLYQIQPGYTIITFDITGCQFYSGYHWANYDLRTCTMEFLQDLLSVFTGKQ